MATKTEDYLGKTDYKVVGTRPIRHDGADKVTLGAQVTFGSSFYF